MAVSSAAADTPELTIDAAVAEALQKNPELQLLEAHAASAERQRAVTGTYAFNPELSYEEALERTVAVTQVLEWPGKRALREAIARRDVASAQAALQGFRVILVANARQGFYRLLASLKLVEVRKRALEAEEGILEVSRRRVSAGFAPVTERTNSEASAVRSRRDLREADRAADQARAALNAMLGREAGAALRASGEFEPLPNVVLHELVDAALERHPDVQAKRLEVEKRAIGSDLAKQERIPDLTIGPLYSQDTRDPGVTKFGVGVSVPLPLWNTGGPKVALAAAERREAEAALAATRREMLANVERAFAGFVAARDEVALYSPGLVAELENELGAARKRYAAGELSYLVLREAQRSYFDHVRDYYDALAGAEAARAELETAAGVSLEELQ